jgi:5,10-methylenetetrahydromethanopterin reductase
MDLALAAGHTSSIRVGPGVSDPYSRHPALIAAAIATLDEVSSGRAQLGLGSGGSGLREMRIDKPRPLRALSEAIAIIRALLTGDEVHFHGELFTVDGVQLRVPGASPAIPIFIATHSPQTLELAGRLADGVLLANIGQADAIAEAIAQVRKGESAAGRPSGSVAIHLRLETCISDDEDVALNLARRRVAGRLANQFPRWKTTWGISITPPMESAGEAHDVERLMALLTDQDVRTTALVGTHMRVASQLQGLVRTGITKVTVRPMAIPGDSLAGVISRFMCDVWPAVASFLTTGAPSAQEVTT